ncbi:MAG: DUF3343 domain-containing protein [Candidatus Lernaella stagnicola]|nr:DUF3343 domain-containing protein [Candidatus Lernaella stagnicola]
MSRVCALTFLSVHDVLKAEKLLQAEGRRVRLIPVPKQISPDCGVALQIACDRLDEVKQTLHELAHRFKGCYYVEDAVFTPLEDDS